MPAALTDKQEKFVDFYCSRYGEWSAAQCAEAAGYGKKGSYARASELLDYKKNPQVHLEIQNRMAMLREQWAIDIDKHMAMLTKIRDEARIKGQYGVVAKCEELEVKVGGLYIEKSMVLSKDIKDDTSNEALRKVWGSREDFERVCSLWQRICTLIRNHHYTTIVVLKLLKKNLKLEREKELQEYNEKRQKEREKLWKK